MGKSNLEDIFQLGLEKDSLEERRKILEDLSLQELVAWQQAVWSVWRGAMGEDRARSNTVMRLIDREIDIRGKAIIVVMTTEEEEDETIGSTA